MEPVKGGNLANPPESVAKIFKDADPQASCASWAVKFAADLDSVMVVLSGMSSLQQMRDNLSYMKDFVHLTDEQKAVIERARVELANIPVIPCTTCDYCAKVCPMNIGISGSFTALNMYTLYKNYELARGREQFDVVIKGHKRASECIKCGKCEKACPQHIEIRKELERVAATFSA